MERAASALIGLLGLAACAGPDTAMLKAMEPEGDGFPPALARAYRAFALDFEAAGQARAAARLGEKARRAHHGWIDAPETVSHRRTVHVVPAERVWFGLTDRRDARGAGAAGANRPPHPEVFYGADGQRVPEDAFVGIAAARERLMAALADGGRHANPPAAAAAQAAFDCWATGMAKGAETVAADCRTAFAEAMPILERAEAAPWKRRDIDDLARLPVCADGVFDKRYAFSFDGPLSLAQADALDRALMEADRLAVCTERGLTPRGENR